MEKQKMIVEVLKNYGCSTAADISRLVKREFGENITVNSVAGTLRPMIARGLAANADNGNGKKVYWITDYGKEKLVK